MTIEEEIGELLVKKNLKIAIAESFTGGLITHKITNVSGSSRYFLLTIVPYDNAMKTKFLDVSDKTIFRYGSVSRATVGEMARNIKKISSADIGLAATGIAGPEGGTEKKPVGLMFLGIAIDNRIETEKFNFSGDRQQIKMKAASAALKSLKIRLQEV